MTLELHMEMLQMAWATLLISAYAHVLEYGVDVGKRNMVDTRIAFFIWTTIWISLSRNEAQNDSDGRAAIYTEPYWYGIRWSPFE